MARVFIDGFESGSTQLWDTAYDVSMATGIAGMDGTYCCNVPVSSYLVKNLSAMTEIYCAFRFRPYSTGSGNRNIFVLYNDTTLLGFIRHANNNSDILRVYNGSGALLASGTAILTISNTYHIEVYFKTGTTNGAWKVKINGVMDIDFTGNVGTSLSVNRLRHGWRSTTELGGFHIDNIVVDNAEWPGNTRIQAIVPTAAGNSTEWTPDTGSNWDRVDEAPPSDTDYNYCNQANLVDLFTFSDLQGQVDTVKCVQVQARALRNGDPLPTKLQLGVRSGGSNYFSSSQDVPTSAKGLAALWETDPATSQAWTVSGVNNAEFGYKSAA